MCIIARSRPIFDLKIAYLSIFILSYVNVYKKGALFSRSCVCYAFYKYNTLKCAGEGKASNHKKRIVFISYMTVNIPIFGPV